MKLFKHVFFLTLIGSIIYCGAWLHMAKKLNSEIDQFFDVDGPLMGYELYGDKPLLSGFPFKPVITYQKGLANDDVKIQFEEIKISGFPLPSFPLDITIDQLAFQDTYQGQIYEADEFRTTLIIPKYFPNEMTRPQLAAWQQEVGEIIFKNIELGKNNMFVKASGPIGLDQNLQPTLNLKTIMTDYDKLIHFMAAETSELSTMQAAIAKTVLDSMAKTDEATGKKFVEFDLKIDSQKLSLGPIQAVEIPTVNWPDNL